jgi:hypothetical protein
MKRAVLMAAAVVALAATVATAPAEARGFRRGPGVGIAVAAAVAAGVATEAYGYGPGHGYGYGYGYGPGVLRRLAPALLVIERAVARSGILRATAVKSERLRSRHVAQEPQPGERDHDRSNAKR